MNLVSNLFSILLLVQLLTSSHHRKVETKLIEKKIVSPRKSKFVEIFQDHDTKGSTQTQVMINFGYPSFKGGGGVFVALGANPKLNVQWDGDNDLIIQYAETLKVLKQATSIRFLKETVKIHYTTIPYK